MVAKIKIYRYPTDEYEKWTGTVYCDTVDEVITLMKSIIEYNKNIVKRCRKTVYVIFSPCDANNSFDIILISYSKVANIRDIINTINEIKRIYNNKKKLVAVG